MKHYEVTAAILKKDKKILCLQRGISKFDYISHKFEFPGGKIEEGETKEESLMRELREELGISINITSNNYFLTIEHKYPDFKITMHSYLCNISFRKINRTEHISEEWLKISELKKLDWAAADIPIVEKLIEVNQ